MIMSVLVGFVEFIGRFIVLVVKLIARVIAFKPKAIVFKLLSCGFTILVVVYKEINFKIKHWVSVKVNLVYDLDTC